MAFLGFVGFVLTGKPKQTGLLSRFFGFAKLVGAHFVFVVWVDRLFFGLVSLQLVNPCGIFGRLIKTGFKGFLWVHAVLVLVATINPVLGRFNAF
jgi:hypothetical protein